MKATYAMMIAACALAAGCNNPSPPPPPPPATSSSSMTAPTPTPPPPPATPAPSDSSTTPPPADAAGRHGAEEINEFSERTDLAMKRIVNMALVAGAGFVLSWLVQSLAAERREVRGRRHKSEHKAAVSDWENEGGGLAAAHEPKH